ncbi:MobA/MobL family protein [Psychrobacter phenylpyruvicus]|uniref:MobA/MobL family protein n=1 Tax=Psychrobacter phenylpyruvicus TaxID=29432 RepID=UPI0007AB6F75|nr:MobA/MobL family protein [Psychrobacter phenylpyruvicus]
MAIYRLEKKSISRGNGHNLCAAIGYRAGLKITDHNPKNTDAKTHDYSKKSDVAHSEIILTDELKNAGIELDFEQIANLVEQGETTKRGKMKKSAKLASEYVLAGSHELSLDENIKAFREFAEQQSREQGVIAMVFVHDPKLGNDARASKEAGDSTRHHDPRNIHAHVVLLSRRVDLTASGRLELGNKSDSELSDTDRKKKSLPPSRTWLKSVREQWANIQNKSLEPHNIAPVTHKSYKDLGLNFKPTQHLGKHAHALQNKGYRTKIGDYNESINKRNHAHLELSTVTFANFAEQADSISKQATDFSIRAIALRERATVGSQRAVATVSNNEQYVSTAVESRERATTESQRAVATVNQSVSRRKQNTASFFRTTSPSPYDEQYRASVDRRERATREFDEAAARFNQLTKLADQLTKRTARESEYRKPETALISNSVRAIAHKTSILFAGRNNKTFEYTDEQRELLNDFAIEQGLATGDLRKDIAVARTFFEDISNIEKHRNIYKLIHKPEDCDINDLKASKSASTATLVDNPILTPHNDVKTPNATNESVTATRRFRR